MRMRVLIGCLAVVGLVVVLLVAGCVGLIGFGVASAMQEIPPYATREEISRQHAKDLSTIDAAISAGNLATLPNSLSPEVLAIYQGDDEVLGRYRITSKSYALMNGAGSGALTGHEKDDGKSQGGQLRNVTCVVITVPGTGGRADAYQVFFRDRQAGAVEKQ
jgi:hypothetical protein